MNKLICLITLASFFLTGCCTIRQQPFQMVKVTSRPSGANVFVDGNYMGITPQAVKMERKVGHYVTLEKEGYQQQNFLLVSEVNRMSLGSNLIFPLVGTGIGAGCGLIAVSGATAGLASLVILSGALIGAGVGAGIGLVGGGFDLHTGNAKSLYPSKVKADLQLTPGF